MRNEPTPQARTPQGGPPARKDHAPSGAPLQPVRKVVVVKKKRGRRRLVLLLILLLLLLIFGGRGFFTGTGFMPFAGFVTEQPPVTSAAVSSKAVEAFYTITISANSLSVNGKVMTTQEIIEDAKKSGLKIKLVYDRDARTPIDEQLLKALEAAGLHASMVIK